MNDKTEQELMDIRDKLNNMRWSSHADFALRDLVLELIETLIQSNGNDEDN